MDIQLFQRTPLGHCFKYYAQSCPTLCDPMDCSLPGSSDHGIRQARILEWVAMPPLGDHPNPGIQSTSLMSPALSLMRRLPHWQVGSLPLAPPGSPKAFIEFVTILLPHYVWFFDHKACGSQLPDPGSNPHRLNQKVKS